MPICVRAVTVSNQSQSIKSIGCYAGIALNETSSSGTNGFRDEVSRQISTRIYHLVSIIIVWANGVFLVMSVSNT